MPADPPVDVLWAADSVEAGDWCGCEFCRWGAECAAAELGPPAPNQAPRGAPQGAERGSAAGDAVMQNLTADPVGFKPASQLSCAPSSGPVLPILGAVVSGGGGGGGGGSTGGSGGGGWGSIGANRSAMKENYSDVNAHGCCCGC